MEETVSYTTATEAPEELSRTLADYIAELREARIAFQDNLAEQIELDGYVQKTPEWQAWKEAMARTAEAKERVAKLEGSVRAIAIPLYSMTGVRKRPGVQIKLVKRVQYDPADATAWARSSMPALLRLDTKAFETTVKSVEGLGAPAKITEEPAAYIDKLFPEEV